MAVEQEDQRAPERLQDDDNEGKGSGSESTMEAFPDLGTDLVEEVAETVEKTGGKLKQDAGLELCLAGMARQKFFIEKRRLSDVIY